MQIMIIKEKNYNRYFIANDVPAKEEISKQIILERLRSGDYYYEKGEKIKASKAIDENKAYRFLLSRNDYEYEGIEIVETEN